MQTTWHPQDPPAPGARRDPWADDPDRTTRREATR